MSKVNSLLTQRLKASSENTSKMTALAERSSSGHLSGFSGVFKVSALNSEEVDQLKTLLEEFQEEGVDIGHDLLQLSSLTSEVRAIHSQSVILHGERIKKAQTLLKKYKEGAFTLWLIRTYGNRQTPYNFLQYFELYSQLPEKLLPRLDAMPRQAAYTLASRSGSLPLKEEIIQSYQGESKEIVLEKIRRVFPLSEKDKRGQNLALTVLKNLERLSDFLSQHEISLTSSQRKKAESLLKALETKLLKGATR